MTQRSDSGYHRALGEGRSLWTVFVLLLAGLFLAATVSSSEPTGGIDGAVSLLAAADDGGSVGLNPDHPATPANHACPPTLGGCSAMALAPVTTSIDAGRCALSPMTATNSTSGIGSAPQFHPPRAFIAA